MAKLFEDRGVQLDRTMQLNVGGNMDFLNMLERERLESKKISKTQAVTSNLQREFKTKDVHIGPSDHVGWLDDRKWAYVRLEGRAFGDVPLNLEYKLEVWDSPNSAGVIIDAVRAAKIAKDRGIGGPVIPASAYLMKSPPQQLPDDVARAQLEELHRGLVAGLCAETGVRVGRPRMGHPERSLGACPRSRRGRRSGVTEISDDELLDCPSSRCCPRTPSRPALRVRCRRCTSASDTGEPISALRGGDDPAGGVPARRRAERAHLGHRDRRPRRARAGDGPARPRPLRLARGRRLLAAAQRRRAGAGAARTRAGRRDSSSACRWAA